MKSNNSRLFLADIGIDIQIKNKGECRYCSILVDNSEITTREHTEIIGTAFYLDDAVVVGILSFYSQQYTDNDGKSQFVYI